MANFDISEKKNNHKVHEECTKNTMDSQEIVLFVFLVKPLCSWW